jgi:hypothetical protein
MVVDVPGKSKTLAGRLRLMPRRYYSANEIISQLPWVGFGGASAAERKIFHVMV